MSIFLNFIIGLVASIIGVTPPGLLNMSAAKISMKEGRKIAFLFSLGVATAVLIQTFIALIFARYIDKHPEIVDMLQKVALGIFLSLTIYFFFIAKNKQKETIKEVNNSKTNRFFSGMFLAALNLLPIPYWVYISITFSSFGWFSFSQPALWACIIGSALGTFFVLGLYAWFFRPKENQRVLKFNMNYVIGTVTVAISIITFIKILRNI